MSALRSSARPTPAQRQLASAMERLSAAYVKSGTPTPQLELELRAIAREIAEAADAVHGIVRAGRGRA